MKRKTFVEIIAALLILLFVYTASSKFLDFKSFRGFLSLSPMFSKTASLIAWGLPSFELLVSLLLFIPRTRRTGLWASFALMAIFTGYLAYMLLFTTNLPCTCGGVLIQMSWKQHFIFNIFFTVLALTGLWLDKRAPNTRFSSNKVTYSATA